jgi:general secretion pathway protein K
MDFDVPPQNSRQTNARGFIVVAVLWILAALSALVLIYLTFVTNTAVVVAGGAERVQSDALVTAGVELAVFRLVGTTEAGRPTSGTFNARVGAGRVAVTFRSEAARVDLNAAPRSLLAGLITGLGASPTNAEGFADRIVAWRTPTEAGADDPESSFYRTSGANYLPRHAPFPQAEELWLVRGIPPLVIEKMLPFVTVFSNQASVNVLDAAPQVLAALPGMSPDNLQAVLAMRSDPAADPRAVRAAAGGEGATLAGSKAYRITVEATTANGNRSAAEAVVLLLEDDAQPYRVLSWRNAAEGGMQKAVLR